MVSKDDRADASYLKSLIEIALSDGLVNENEIIFLNKVAARFNLSAAEIKEIKKHYRKVNFTPPDDFSIRAALLYDIVNMMMVDGNVDQKEMQLCHKYALLLNFKGEMVNELIDLINGEIARGNSRESTVEILSQRLAS